MFNAVLGALLGIVVLGGIATLSRGGMGGGDVKLSAVLGVFLGWRGLFNSLVLGFTLGALVAAILIALGKKSLKDFVPFGPFMAIGSLITMILPQVFIFHW